MTTPLEQPPELRRSRLFETGRFLPESTFTPTDYYDKADQYSALDAMGVELEVAEFLYGLVRLLKPERVCETGAYPGVATEALLRGIEDNGVGVLTSTELDPDYRYQLIERFLEGMVTSFRRPVLFNDGPPESYGLQQLTFLDSPYEERVQEFQTWCATATEGSVLVVHDTKAEWDKGRLQHHGVMVFDTPRGLGMLMR